MANRINNKRRNKLLSYRNNYYEGGGPVASLDAGMEDMYAKIQNPLDSPNFDMSNVVGEIKPMEGISGGSGVLGGLRNLFKGGSTSPMSEAVTAVGGMVGSAIGGGLQSGAGNAISSLGNLASNIPGPWGAIAGAGLNVMGGLTNRMFGSKLNEENIKAVEGTTSRLNNFQSDASSFDTLANTWGSTALGTNFKNSYIGKDGWFSSKAKNKAKELRKNMKLANAFVENTLQNNADNITQNMMNNLEANYAAFGGELNTNGADFPTGLMFIDEGGTHESNPYEGVPIGIDPNGKPNLVEEGEAIYNDYVFSNRLTVPKAIRSKYKLRGTSNLTFANAVKQLSKYSSERPNDPISQDTLHDIMSDLAQIQEGVRNERHIGNKFADGGFTYKPYKYVAGYNGNWFDSNGNYTQSYKDKVNGMSIEDINNAFNEQYKFYTNDNNKGTDRWKAIDAFYTANPQYKVASTNLTDAALPTIRALATDGKPGFMHQFFNDATPLDRQNRYFLRGKDAQGNPTVTSMSVTPWEGLNDKGQKFAEAYPNYKFYDKQVRPQKGNTIYTDYYYDELKPTENKSTEEPAPLDLGRSSEHLRYAPAVGLGLATLTDALGLTNKPNYGEAAMIEAATKGGSYMPVDWNPIGNKLAYKPFDRDYYTNKLNAASGASRRAIANQSGGNSGRAIAGLLASDYNSQGQLGDLFRKAEEYNLEQRQRVEEFNRVTNQANSQGQLQADMANQQAYANARDFNLKGIMAAAEMRQKARMAAESAKSANLSGLLSALGDIGYENKSMNMVRRLAEAGLVPMSKPMVDLYSTASARKRAKKYKKLDD